MGKTHLQNRREICLLRREDFPDAFYLKFEMYHKAMSHKYGRAKAGRPARTYIQQLCEDTLCSPEDLPEAMNDREKWREKVRDIRASCTT